jgi:hypothetical protein
VGDYINGTRHGPNSQFTADKVDTSQTRYPVEINQHLRPSQAQIHEGDQTLPTGQKGRFITELRQILKHFIQRDRRNVPESSWSHLVS